jgi:MoxR-like ATPase
MDGVVLNPRDAVGAARALLLNPTERAHHIRELRKEKALYKLHVHKLEKLRGRWISRELYLFDHGLMWLSKKGEVGRGPLKDIKGELFFSDSHGTQRGMVEALESNTATKGTAGEAKFSVISGEGVEHTFKCQDVEARDKWVEAIRQASTKRRENHAQLKQHGWGEILEELLPVLCAAQPFNLLLRSPSHMLSTTLITRASSHPRDPPRLIFVDMTTTTAEECFGSICISSGGGASFREGYFPTAFSSNCWLVLDFVEEGQVEVLQRIRAAMITGKICVNGSTLLTRHSNFRLIATSRGSKLAAHTGGGSISRSSADDEQIRAFNSIFEHFGDQLRPLEVTNDDDVLMLVDFVRGELQSSARQGFLVQARRASWGLSEGGLVDSIAMLMVREHKKLIEVSRGPPELASKSLLQWTSAIVHCQQQANVELTDECIATVEALFAYPTLYGWDHGKKSSLTLVKLPRTNSENILRAQAQQYAELVIASFVLQYTQTEPPTEPREGEEGDGGDDGRGKEPTEPTKWLVSLLPSLYGDMLWATVSSVSTGESRSERRGSAVHNTLPSESIPVRVSADASAVLTPASAVLTPALRNVWPKVLHALNANRMTLLVGSASSGKSTALQQLSLCVRDASQVCSVTVTAEMEIEDLVRLRWAFTAARTNGNDEWDGLLGIAMSKGDWIILENLHEASPSLLRGLALVLHRAQQSSNSLPPQLPGREDVHPGFRIMATANITDGFPPHCLESCMTVVSMPSGNKATRPYVEDTLKPIARCVLGTALVEKTLRLQANTARDLAQSKAQSGIKSQAEYMDLERKCFDKAIEAVCFVLVAVARNQKDKQPDLFRLCRIFTATANLLKRHEGWRFEIALFTAFHFCCSALTSLSTSQSILKEVLEVEKKVVWGSLERLVNEVEVDDVHHKRFTTHSSLASAAGTKLGVWLVELLQRWLQHIFDVFGARKDFPDDTVAPKDFPSSKSQLEKLQSMHTAKSSIVELVSFCEEARLPLVLQGPPAIGKTYSVRVIADSLQRELKVLPNSGSTGIDEYFGKMAVEATDGTLTYHPGPLVDAMKDGGWFLADEFNLAHCSVLGALLHVLECSREFVNPVNHERIQVHENFRFFATQNYFEPEAGGGQAGQAQRKMRGRQELPLSVVSRCIVGAVGEEHVERLVAEHLKPLTHIERPMEWLDEEGRALYANVIAATFREINKPRKHEGSRRESSWDRYSYITLRSLLRWIRRTRLMPRKWKAKDQQLEVNTGSRSSPNWQHAGLSIKTHDIEREGQKLSWQEYVVGEGEAAKVISWVDDWMPKATDKEGQLQINGQQVTCSCTRLSAKGKPRSTNGKPRSANGKPRSTPVDPKQLFFRVNVPTNERENNRESWRQDGDFMGFWAEKQGHVDNIAGLFTTDNWKLRYFVCNRETGTIMYFKPDPASSLGGRPRRCEHGDEYVAEEGFAEDYLWDERTRLDKTSPGYKKEFKVGSIDMTSPTAITINAGSDLTGSDPKGTKYLLRRDGVSFAKPRSEELFKGVTTDWHMLEEFFELNAVRSVRRGQDYSFTVCLAAANLPNSPVKELEVKASSERDLDLWMISMGLEGSPHHCMMANDFCVHGFALFWPRIRQNEKQTSSAQESKTNALLDFVCGSETQKRQAEGKPAHISSTSLHEALAPKFSELPGEAKQMIREELEQMKKARESGEGWGGEEGQQGCQGFGSLDEDSIVGLAIGQMSLAASCREPVLLVGPTSCKKHAVRHWTHCNAVRFSHIKEPNRRLRHIHLSVDTQVADLIGQFRPCHVDGLVNDYNRVRKLLKERVDALSTTNGDNDFNDDERAVDQLTMAYGEPLRLANSLPVPAERLGMSELEGDLAALRTWLQGQHALGREGEDAGVKLLLDRLGADFEMAQRNVHKDHDAPEFILEYGPVLCAVLTGSALLLEGLDKPAHSVIERLNSLMELEPSLFLTETNDHATRAPQEQDSLSSSSRYVQIDQHTQYGIRVPASFQIFATVHQPPGTVAHLALGSATISRFTEIFVPQYTWHESKQVLSGLGGRKGFSTLLKEAKGNSDDAPNMLGHLVKEATGKAGEKTGTHQDPVNVHNVMKLARTTAAVMELTKDFDKGEVLKEELRADTALSKKLQEGASFAVQLQLAKLVLSQEEEEFQGPSFGRDTTDTNLERLLEVLLEHIAAAALKASTPSSSDGIYATKTTRRILAIFAISERSGLPVLLSGPPGIGKTAVVGFAARSFGKQCTRLNLSRATDIDMLCGNVQMDGRHFSWVDGPLLRAIKKGHYILLDEMNLAPPALLAALALVVDPSETHVLLPGMAMAVEKHKDMRVFATMNPVSAGGDKRITLCRRSTLPWSVKQHFVEVCLGELSKEEQREIALSRATTLVVSPTTLVGDKTSSLSAEEVVGCVVDVHTRVVEDVKLKEATHQVFGLRDILKAVDLFGGNLESSGNTGQVYSMQRLQLALKLAYQVRFQVEEHRQLVENIIFDATATASVVEGVHDVTTTPATESMKFGGVVINGILMKRAGAPEHEPDRPEFVHTPDALRYLSLLGAGTNARRAMLLLGSSASGKRSLVFELSRLVQQRLVVVPMHCKMQSADLIGKWAVKEGRLAEAEGQQASSRIQIGFNCSALVLAAKEGRWVMLDGIELAPPEVLERLNSLTEERPSLLVHEAGRPEQEEIHKDFRLFLTCGNSKHLPRAFVNRVITVYLPQLDEGLCAETVSDPNHTCRQLLGKLLGSLLGEHVSEREFILDMVLQVHVHEKTERSCSYWQCQRAVRMLALMWKDGGGDVRKLLRVVLPRVYQATSIAAVMPLKVSSTARGGGGDGCGSGSGGGGGGRRGEGREGRGVLPYRICTACLVSYLWLPLAMRSCLVASLVSLWLTARSMHGASAARSMHGENPWFTSPRSRKKISSEGLLFAAEGVAGRGLPT